MKQGWQLKKLGEVCKTSSGGTPLKDKVEYYNSGNIPFLRSGEVCEKYIYKTEMFITELGLTNSSAKLFPVDTVLIAMYGATAGQVGILKIESTTNQAVCGILPCKEVLSEFIYYFFLFYKDELVKQAVGGTQPNISQFKIKDTVLPLPPLSEQHRIVEKLDRAFEKIEELRKTAEGNLQEARSLFDASLRFELKCEGWQLKKLGEVCKTSSGGTPLKDKIEYYDSGSIPFLRSGEVCEKYIFKTEMFITELGLTNSSAKLFPVDTVLIAMYGATAGQVGILKIESTTNQAVCGILPCKEVISEFIYYFFLSYKDELVKQAVGGAQPNISQLKIKNTVIPLPSLKEQQRIVEKLDAISDRCRQMENNYKQTISLCDGLKQSLLRKAFNGEL